MTMSEGESLKKNSKKFPTWLKWFYGIFILISIPLALLVFLVVSSETPKKEIKSWEEWQKYRDQIQVFSKAIVVAKNATEMYIDATKYRDLYSPNCPFPEGCNEFKGLLRVAAEAAQDGILTPQELKEIAESKVLLDLIIKEKDSVYKKKFNK